MALGLGFADDLWMEWNYQAWSEAIGFDESFHMAATADRVPSVYIRNGRVVNWIQPIQFKLIMRHR